MKQFIFRIILFTLPILGLFIAEGLLPSHLFTFRPWEAIDFQTRFHLDRTFHPNTELRMKSVGELRHHTKQAIIQEETWKTDIIGNRNNTFVKDPDVLIIGDSFAVGAAVTQDSTITNLLQTELGSEMKVYNIAPAEFYVADYYLKKDIIKKPKLIIYSISERYVPYPMKKYTEMNSMKTKLKTILRNNMFFSNVSIFMDKSLRFYSKNWIRARLNKDSGDGVPGVKGSNMYFFNSKSYPYDPNMVYNFEIDLKRTKDNIVSFKKYCDSLHIDFLFLPMPNKATVYYDLVPYKEQPKYVFKLDSMLNAENVRTVNAVDIYNEYRKSNNKLLYHLDDTHWNSNGVHIVTQEIAKEIKKTKGL